MTDSNDWLASIDLDAVKPTGPRKTAKAKKPKHRIVYGEPGRLAPTIPSWAQSRGPDQQRAVTAVAGKFVPTHEICQASPTYDEACQLITLIEASDHPNKTRLLNVLRDAITPYEFKLADEAYREEEAEKTKELNKLVSDAVNLITLED